MNMRLLKRVFTQRSSEYIASTASTASASDGNALRMASSTHAVDAEGPIELGGALFAEGRFAEALACTEAALERNPDLLDLMFARGSVLFGWGRFREALDAYAAAERAGLNHPELDTNMAWAHVSMGQFAEAERRFRKAIAVLPDAVKPWIGLANAYEVSGVLGDHADVIENALGRWPDDYDASVFIGGCRLTRGDRDGAVAAFRRAIAIDPTRSRAWHNLGSSLDWRSHLPEAINALERAHALECEHGINGAAFVNLAMAKREDRKWPEAFALLREGLARNPDINGHWLYSAMLLEMGQFDEGWIQHEFRWLKEPLRSVRWTIRRSQWCGQDISGKRVVLHAEQGLGDVFQFIRYAPHLKSLGATVLFDSFKGFKEIGNCFDGVDEVLADGKMPEFDFHLPLISLPRVFGTNARTVPLGIPYLTVPEGARAKWHDRFSSASELKVGLAWGGNPKHLRDYQRSIQAGMLRPLCNVKGTRFYSLQKGPQASEPEVASLDLVDLGPELVDYCDTAAVLAELDLVISVDTSVAHAAGALGRPVWVLLPTPPDWRWLLEGDSSAWYPTMRLFRQHTRNEWEPVIRDVATALQELVASNHRDLLDLGRLSQAAAVSGGPAIAPRNGAAELTGEWIPKLTRVTEARYGIMQYLPDGSESAVSLPYFGEYRHQELALIGKFLAPGKWVLDAGAGIGLTTLCFAQAVGDSGHVLAFEPDALLYQIARQNVAANGARGVTLLQRTLGPEWKRHPDRMSSKGNRASDDSIDGLRLSRLDWVRIGDQLDALNVLTGARATIWKFRPWIFVSDAGNGTIQASWTILRDYGYQLLNFSAPLYNPDNYNRRDKDIFENRHAQGTLCIPEEIGVDVELDFCTVIREH